MKTPIIFGFVFARGGSKGLQHKNMLKLGDSSLVGHSVMAARTVPSIARVFVSTDDEDIANEALAHGAEVIQRPADLASDTASEWKAWQHAIQHLKAQGTDFDVFISLPPTSPLRGTADVQNCIDALRPGIDVVITVTPAARNPYFNMVLRDHDGTSRIVNALGPISRRQDAPAVYDITTVAYAARPDFILNEDGLFAGTVHSVIVPRERAVDIDDAIDCQLAEVILALKEIACN